MKIIVAIVLNCLLSLQIHANELPEMLIGRENISPGITLIFEGAIKDDVAPYELFLLQEKTDIHIEMLANWNDQAPPGSPEGGFIPYLNVTATITEQHTGNSKTIDLVPHINLSDNFHYAQNIKLPGMSTSKYTILFSIDETKMKTLGLHYDWRKTVGDEVIKPVFFSYKDLDFSKISSATRR
jgi:uncharacterized protein involved in high-affinity Fe2+ transport